MLALSVDGMLGRETLDILRNVSQLMAETIDELILHMQGYIDTCIKISVARSYLWMISGDQLPILLNERDPDWDPESGLGLAQ